MQICVTTKSHFDLKVGEGHPSVYHSFQISLLNRSLIRRVQTVGSYSSLRKALRILRSTHHGSRQSGKVPELATSIVPTHLD